SLSERIAHNLELHLVGTAARHWNRSSTRNPEAFHLYHQGRFFWNKSGKENCEKARTFFQQAITKDPNYALAYAGLADCYVHEGCGSWPRHERIRQARHWATKALELDDGLAEAHATLATILFFYDWNRLEAEREFLRAIERNPSYANARHLYSFALAAMGRGDDALAQAELALESDAASVVSSVNMGAILYHLRKFDRAIAQLESCLKMETDLEKVSPYLALAYLEVGRYSEAMEAFRKTLASPAGLVHLGYGFARTGQRAEALKILTTVQEQVARGEAPANHLTFLYLGLGENDMAFRWLEKEFEDRAAGMMYLKTAAFYDPIRSDPRFFRLLRRVGLEPQEEHATGLAPIGR
ncbi:MAG TPA: hypothetical protein VHP35_05505, partial [Terriglobia bacterium]|nr:hypothetical protein [Terriglobia bacterium]